MPTALVTGSPERVSDIVVALKSEGFDILAAGTDTPDTEADLAPRSVDCYVQLPNGAPPAEGTALGRARAVIAGELLARFDAAARLAPLLAPRATVVLVADQRADGPPLPDVRARWGLVRLLSEAILRDHGAAGVRTAVVDGAQAPAEIAALARSRSSGVEPWSSYSGLAPDLGFADWRDEVLCLATSLD